MAGIPTIMRANFGGEGIRLLDVAGGTGTSLVYEVADAIGLANGVHEPSLTSPVWSPWPSLATDRPTTGDIAFRLMQRALESHPHSPPAITVCDINAEMLKVGQQRATGVFPDPK